MEGMVGEIKIFAGGFTPRGWLFCDGQILEIKDYEQLYSVIGKDYVKDMSKVGEESFQLPDLQGRVPVHSTGTNRDPQISWRGFATRFGREKLTLLSQHLPSFDFKLSNASVDLPVNTQNGLTDTPDPSKGVLGFSMPPKYSTTATIGAKYGGQSIPVKGSASSAGPSEQKIIELAQPSLALNFVICHEGVRPVNEENTHNRR